MNAVLIDSCVILDIFEDDLQWADWSESVLEHYADTHKMFINPMIYSEVSIGFQRIEEMEEAIGKCGFQVIPIPKEALFLAGKAFLKYRRRSGLKVLPLPDFFIGAHAAVADLPLITRDKRRFSSYFPTVDLICPDAS